MEMNCKGLVSPQPILFVREVLDSLDPEDFVTVIYDDEKAAQQLRQFALHQGCEVKDTTVKNDKALQIIKKEKTAAAPSELPVSAASKAGHIVLLTSSRFGQGNPRLGESLMQSFLFSMTLQDPLPDAIVFMNAAVALLCQDSEALRDLKTLQQEGVAILADEASLNFYGYRDSLMIGEKRDMNELTALLMGAAHVTSL